MRGRKSRTSIGHNIYGSICYTDPHSDSNRYPDSHSHDYADTYADYYSDSNAYFRMYGPDCLKLQCFSDRG